MPRLAFLWNNRFLGDDFHMFVVQLDEYVIRDMYNIVYQMILFNGMVIGYKRITS